MKQSNNFRLSFLKSLGIEYLEEGQEKRSGGCQETQGSLSFVEHIRNGVDKLLHIVLIGAFFENTSQTEDGFSPDVEADLVGYGNLDDGIGDGVNQNIGYNGCDH